VFRLEERAQCQRLRGLPGPDNLDRRVRGVAGDPAPPSGDQRLDQDVRDLGFAGEQVTQSRRVILENLTVSGSPGGEEGALASEQVQLACEMPRPCRASGTLPSCDSCVTSTWPLSTTSRS